MLAEVGARQLSYHARDDLARERSGAAVNRKVSVLSFAKRLIEVDKVQMCSRRMHEIFNYCTNALATFHAPSASLPCITII